MSECSSVEKIYPEPVTEIRGPLFQLLFKMVIYRNIQRMRVFIVLLVQGCAVNKWDFRCVSTGSMVDIVVCLMARMVDQDQETPGILLRTLRILELKLLDSVCLR